MRLAPDGSRPGLAIGLAALLWATACATPGLPARPLAPEAASGLWEDWRARTGDRAALRCSARLAVDGPGTRLRARNRLVVERPTRLRVEVQGFLGTTAGVLTVDEAQYAFLQAEPRRFETGPVDAALLARIFGVDVAPATVVAVLLGAPDPADLGDVVGGQGLADGAREIRFASGGSARLDAAGQLRRLRVEGGAEGPGWQADFADYADVAGAAVAHRVTLSLDEGPTAVLVLRDVELNPTLTPDIFRLEDPAPTAGLDTGVSGG